MKSENAKKKMPLWKKIIIGIVAFFVISAILDAVHNDDKTAQPEQIAQAKVKIQKRKTKNTDKTQNTDTANPSKIINKFATSVQQKSGMTITDMQPLDIQTQSKQYHEFTRLPFKNSVGVTGSINNCNIIIVVYDDNTTLRVYLNGSKTDVQVIYPALVRSFDKNITEEDINAVTSTEYIANISTAKSNSVIFNDIYNVNFKNVETMAESKISDITF